MKKTTVLSIEEIQNLVPIVRAEFEPMLARYDTSKYSPVDYERFKKTFSSLSHENEDIENALKWKWGHAGKENFPARHKNLIAEVKKLWPEFLLKTNSTSPITTFDWWTTHLNRPTTYITTAFITHLVHYKDDLPIIDRHNFNAMNSLMKIVKKNYQHKKKPSNWQDICNLQSFMMILASELNVDLGTTDRFLMMYGRYRVNPISSMNRLSNA